MDIVVEAAVLVAILIQDGRRLCSVATQRSVASIVASSVASSVASVVSVVSECGECGRSWLRMGAALGRFEGIVSE